MPPLAFLAQHEHIRTMRGPLLVLFLLVAGCTPGTQAPDAKAGADAPGVASSGLPSAAANCTNRWSDEIGGPFHLTAQDGSPTTEANFKDRKTLVFFGFTNCADVCPITLYKLGKAMSLLPAGKTPPHTLFISVDPARDTPDALTQYIRSNGFPKDITGLTGTLEELEQVSKEFVAPFSRVEDAESSSGYVMSHSPLVYLMDEHWKLKTFFTDDQSPQDIAACLADIG